MDQLDTLAQAFLAEVQAASSVLIGTHVNPDGDAIGSALAMSYLLDQLGIRNEVVSNNEPPDNLLFLPGLERIHLSAEAEHPLGIVLDLDALHRLGRMQPEFEKCRRLIVVDHHVPHEQPGDLRIVDVTSPATALILFRLIRALGQPISPEMATCLLAGIVTDTGSFRYRNTTPESLHAAASLLEHGGDIVKVSEEVYQRKSLASQLLLGRTLSKMQFSADGRIAWATLSPADFQEAGAKESDTEGIVNELLAIKTVQIAALLRQPSSDKIVRASLRSREAIDVSAAARTFDGGGHRNAAGVSFSIPLAEAEAALVAALEQCLESS